MWLLDANVPAALVVLLEEFGIESATAQSRGWGALSNGALVEVAATGGFSCLLTRDRSLSQTAARALKRFSGFAVILVTLPQLRERKFLEAFRSAWQKDMIAPVGGRVISWPPQERE